MTDRLAPSSTPSPLPAALANLLDRLDQNDPEEEDSPQRRPRALPLTLSQNQHRLWILDRLRPGDPGFNLSVTVRPTETLDLPALRRSLDEIVTRHEVLRTRYLAPLGEPRQRIDPPRRVALEEIAAASRTEALERAAELFCRPFDLARDLMLRAAVLGPFPEVAAEERWIVLILHHIAADGWSIGLLLEELSTLYAAFRKAPAAPSPLPPLKLQYLDLAHWQEKHLARRRGELVSYWRKTLAKAPAPLRLAADRPRPLMPSGRGDVCRFRLERALREGLERLALGNEGTLFMVLLAAYDAWLFRFSGESDQLVSVPTANRGHPAAERLIGFFNTMTVVRTRFSGSESFLELLGQVREAAIDAFAHQELPQSELVEALFPAGRDSEILFAQVEMALQNTRSTEGSPGFERLLLPLHTGVVRADLHLSLWEVGEELWGDFEYSTDLFDAATLERRAASFEVLIRGLLDDPSTAVDRLALLSEAERRALLVNANRSERPYDLERCLHELVADQIARTPDAISVRDEEGALSYRELGRRATALAGRLRARSTLPGTAVAVFLERSLRLPPSLLAVLEAGAVAVPLDPEHPEERLGYILCQTRAKIVLTDPHLKSRLPSSIDALVLEPAAEPLAPREPPTPSPAGPEDLAYFLYTSGSTGRPKGVALHHRGLLNRLLWQQEVFPLRRGDRVLQNFSISFDAAIWQIFAPWLVGAQVVLPRPGGHRDLAYLAAFTADFAVTCVDLVPSLVPPYLEEELAGARALRQLVCGGEALHRGLARRIFDTLPGVRLVNIYGPTETSLTISAASITPPVADRGRLSGETEPIGHPVANMEVYLLDRWGEPVPTGVVGEVFAAGEGITRGYVHSPSLTAKRYLPDPFGKRPGGRMYRTGDLARYRSDGQLEFSERLDHQVKIRGIRVEPGEIEAQLQGLVGVRAAVVLARGDIKGTPTGERRLVGYVVPDVSEGIAADTGLTAASLRARLLKKLPAALVPSFFVFLDALPTSVNGKVRRDSLPPPGDALDEARAPEPPRDALESELAGIFRRALRLEEISVTDHFFELGGHSLLAVKLMSEIGRRFGVELGLQQLYAAGTVRGMAEILRSRSAPSSRSG